MHADAWGSGDRSDHRYDEYKGPVFGGFGGSEGAACRVYAPGGKVGETTFFPVDLHTVVYCFCFSWDLYFSSIRRERPVHVLAWAKYGDERWPKVINQANK